MIFKISAFIAFLSILVAGCSKEYDCLDSQIQPAFIAFPISDIDSFVIRKYRANDNYQVLIDTFMVVYGYSGQYQTSTDTTTVFVNDGKHGIKAGFDWQLFIPATNKTVFISEIISEKKTGKCGSGIFSMDKFGCSCINKVFSAKRDNLVITFPISATARNQIFIRN